MVLFLKTLLKLSLLGSALALVLTALRPLLRGRVSRRAAYYLWLLVLLRLCVPVGIDLPLPAAAEPDPAANTAQAAPVIAPVITPDVSGPAADTPPPDMATPIVPVEPVEAAVPSPDAPSLRERLLEPGLWMGLWVAGAAASALWFLLGYRRASRTVLGSAGSAPEEALAVLRELDPADLVTLVESPVVNTPLQLGAMRPVIVLPCGVTDEARLRDILAHELIHVRRHDLLFKWFAAAAASLHWFNPVMLLVRREIGRNCELSCDEAVVRSMDEQARRHYGETLLALAAHAPKGLGPITVTLCEERKQLKERLFCIAKYKKSGPMVIFLSLVLTMVIGACALVTGATPVEPGGPEPSAETEAGPQEADTPPPVVYELDGGLTIAFPADIVEQLIVKPPDANRQGDSEVPPAVYLLAVYEKKSYEDTLADWGYEGGGYLFGIARYTQAQYELYLTEDGSGISPFATDGTFYYMYTFATDVQFYRSGIDDYSTVSFEPWQKLEERVGDILDDFIERNGLEPFSTSTRPFSYDGVHYYVLYENETWEMNMVLTLSQPAVQGEGGIWCVERCRNAYGQTYLQFPSDGVTPAATYYSELQAQADAGEHPELLSPVGAAQAWLEDYYSYTDAVTVSPDDFTLVEGEPAGNVWVRLSDILGDADQLEALWYSEGKAPLFMVQTFDEPAYYRDERQQLSLLSAASYGLWAKSWLKAEPRTLSGRAVRCTAENGDTVIFLEEGGVVCIQQDGTEEWLQDAFWQEHSPYKVMYGICNEWAHYTDGGAELRFSEEEVSAAVETVRQMFETEPWHTACTLQSCEWDAVQSERCVRQYMENGRGSVSGVSEENVIVITAPFVTGDEEAVRGTTLEPESNYPWHYWLIREDRDSPWVIDDFGA